MVFLIKSQDWIRLCCAPNEESLKNRLYVYNPVFEIIHCCEGTQKIITEIKKKIPFTNSWIKSDPNVIQKIIELMNNGLSDLINETKELVLKRYNFLMNKIKKYNSKWIESSYSFDNWSQVCNLCTGFYKISSRIEILETKEPDTFKKIEELENYIKNIQKIMDCKRYCDDIENIEILPGVIVSIKNYWEEKNVSIKQITSINNKDIYEIRLVSDFDFDYI